MKNPSVEQSKKKFKMKFWNDLKRFNIAVKNQIEKFMVFENVCL